MRPWTLLGMAVLAFVGCAEKPRPRVARTQLTADELRLLQGPTGPVTYSALSAAPTIAWWVPLAEWRTRYPAAARWLDEWRATYPSAADRMVAWNERRPERLEVLVFWRMTHPYEKLSALFLERHDWDDFAAIAEADPEAVRAFLEWVWASGAAAEELAIHHRALGFALGAEAAR
jgi:hypothetical protein